MALLLIISRNANIKCRYKTANYLIIRYITNGGGIYGRHTNDCIRSAVLIAEVCRQKVIHNPIHSVSMHKVSKNSETEWQKQQLFSNF